MGLSVIGEWLALDTPVVSPVVLDGEFCP